jgi:queuine/archaeosine tRNA-ribosyltransferase
MGQFVNFCAGTNMNVLPAKQVDAMLINVPDNGSSERVIEYTLKMMKSAKVKFSMLDSGGFQLLKAEINSKKITFDDSKPVINTESEINLAPKHDIIAAAKLKPHIAVGLDFPIRNITDPDEREFEFMRKLGFNVRWAIESAKLRKMHCPEVKFYLPIQCYNLSHLDLFLKLIGDIDFDGVSMPIRNLSTNKIALFMLRFYQLGIKRVHLLGTSKFFAIALSAYMAKNLFDFVSFDATTWEKRARYEDYLNPLDLSSDKIPSNIMINEKISINCGCPFCRGKTFTNIKNLPYPDKIAFLRSHNWWVTEKATRDLYKNCGDLVQFEKFLKIRCQNTEKIEELCSILSLIDVLKDSDISVLQAVLI